MKARVIHLEIPADDTGRGREFWGSMFGIDWQSFEGPVEYHMFGDADEGWGGALYPRQASDHDQIRVYFGTDDLGGRREEPRAGNGLVCARA